MLRGINVKGGECLKGTGTSFRLGMAGKGGKLEWWEDYPIQMN